MVMSMIKGGNGGGGVTSIEADTSQSLGSITTQGGSYTATENCIMVGTLVGSSGAQAQININSNLFFAIDDQSNWAYLGYGNYGVFIPKDSVVSTRSGHGIYNLNFYKMK